MKDNMLLSNIEGVDTLVIKQRIENERKDTGVSWRLAKYKKK